MTRGVCAGCGAVAWELLTSESDACLGCRPNDYDDGDDLSGWAQDLGACTDCPHPEGCAPGRCEQDAEVRAEQEKA